MSKSNLVKGIFNDLSSNYDSLNDVFSFGLHRLWKRKLLLFLSPLRGEKWVDLCCGTGDLAISLANLLKKDGEVYAIDSAKETLNIAQRRCLADHDLAVNWINKDIFDDHNKLGYFDGAVMAYGLRNLSDPYLGLERIRKFLKPGGRAGILDFNRNDDNSIRDIFQKLYINNLVIPIASNLGFKEHFRYLADSINEFPKGINQEKLGIEAGFSEAKYYPIALGQMGILILKN